MLAGWSTTITLGNGQLNEDRAGKVAVETDASRATGMALCIKCPVTDCILFSWLKPRPTRRLFARGPQAAMRYRRSRTRRQRLRDVSHGNVFFAPAAWKCLRLLFKNAGVTEQGDSFTSPVDDLTYGVALRHGGRGPIACGGHLCSSREGATAMPLAWVRLPGLWNSLAVKWWTSLCSTAPRSWQA